jgi:uncharacterized membrane protein
MKISINYTLILVATIVWCAAIVLAPVLATMGNAPRISAEMYQFFGKVCHQIDSRSLHIGGEKFAVCARCSAIYFSFLAMLLVYPFLPKITIKESRLWILVIILPMLLDVLLDAIGIHASTISTRLCTGSFFGLGIAYLLLPDLEHGISGFITTLKNHFE